MLVSKDSYFSGSMFIKGNLTIYGTQSVAYITSSQLNIATNLITVNTATPSVRFGGLAVYDSGSTGTGMTGSLLWDSQNNSWIYDNPSGSGNYDSSMVIMGPRNASALGSEQGLNCNYLIQGHGHHQKPRKDSPVHLPGGLRRLLSRRSPDEGHSPRPRQDLL
jgi:hypothetical protein